MKANETKKQINWNNQEMFFRATLSCGHLKVVKQTEKAVMLECDKSGLNPGVKAWFPKSAFKAAPDYGCKYDGYFRAAEDNEIQLAHWFKMDRNQARALSFAE